MGMVNHIFRSEVSF